MATYHVLYTFRDKPTFLCIDADTSVEAIEKAARQHPQIKTFSKAERIYSYKAVQDELRFTWTKTVADWILALPTSARFYIEGNSDVSKGIEDKYRELTAEILVPESGTYNIAPNDKRGVEGTVYFDSSIGFPEDFGIEPEKAGQVNSTKLFWVLIRMGFRLNGEHKTEEIRNSIPAEFHQVAGVA